MVDWVEIGDCRLALGDCREILPTLGKVDCVVTDPPYHGVKSNEWDNQWKTDDDFLLWVDGLSVALHNVSKFNGSLYWFTSPQMSARVEVTLRNRFNIINNIVWDKSGGRKGIGGTGIDVSALRGFWTANTERLIFAEPIGGDNVAANAAGYEAACEAVKVAIIGDYLRSEFRKAGVTNRDIAALFPSKTGGMTGCVSNWLLGRNVPTSDQYHVMRDYLGSNYLRRDYEHLRRDYEHLRRDYEHLRRPFVVTSSDEWGDVWKFGIERGGEHPTQKPLALMRHIIKISSRSGSTVLDPFMGSGTTGVACVKLGRSFVGIELDEGYFDIACRRIEKAYAQPDLFVAPPEPKPEQLDLIEAMP